MRSLCVGLVLCLVMSMTAMAGEYKGVAIKSVKTDRKRSPAEHVITIIDGQKDVEVCFKKDMKIYDIDGKEVELGNLFRVFNQGNVVDLKTTTVDGVERITEAKLIKKGSQ